MLRFLFWTLLFANAALFAYHHGYLNAWIPDGRDPARMTGQINADKIKLISASEFNAAAASVSTSAPASASTIANAASPEAQPAGLACTAIGNFDTATAKRFETLLQPLNLGDKLSRHEVQENARNIVYIPSQGSKEAVDKKANELRHLGITDFYIVQDAGELHWGISLGVFKTEEAARAQLAALNQKGVHSARLGTHSVTASKVEYQLHNLDAKTKASLDKIALEFPHIDVHACTQDAAVDSKSAVGAVSAAKEPLPREATH